MRGVMKREWRGENKKKRKIIFRFGQKFQIFSDYFILCIYIFFDDFGNSVKIRFVLK